MKVTGFCININMYLQTVHYTQVCRKDTCWQEMGLVILMVLGKETQQQIQEPTSKILKLYKAMMSNLNMIHNCFKIQWSLHNTAPINNSTPPRLHFSTDQLKWSFLQSYTFFFQVPWKGLPLSSQPNLSAFKTVPCWHCASLWMSLKSFSLRLWTMRVQQSVKSQGVTKQMQNFWIIM